LDKYKNIIFKFYFQEIIESLIIKLLNKLKKFFKKNHCEIKSTKKNYLFQNLIRTWDVTMMDKTGWSSPIGAACQEE
jgi:hypothetical protein